MPDIHVSEAATLPEITEPEPGRRLVETLTDGIVTTFVVEPVDEQRRRLTITTDCAKPGLRGWFERLLAPGYLRKVYVAELAQIARVATGDRPPSVASGGHGRP